MASDPTHVHGAAPTRLSLPPAGWTVVVVTLVVIATAWVLTWSTAGEFERLVMLQIGGAQPVERLQYLVLSGVMMVAMMLPSSLPMVATYRALAERDAEGGAAATRTLVFCSGYFVVWAFFTAVAMAALMAFGATDGTAWGRYALGGLLVSAGVYQFTGWKRFCLDHCRTPMQFVMAHWRSGHRGAFRMGLSHAWYCLGCCWLLMLVLFTAGAMSVLWMGVFAGLVLVEKTWSRGPGVSRLMGTAAVVVGLLVLGVTWRDGGVDEPAGAVGDMEGMARMGG